MLALVKNTLGRLSNYGPLLFAFGFLTPLIATIIESANIALPMDASPLLGGFIIATLWGGIAQVTGRWI